MHIRCGHHKANVRGHMASSPSHPALLHRPTAATHALTQATQATRLPLSLRAASWHCLCRRPGRHGSSCPAPLAAPPCDASRRQTAQWPASQQTGGPAPPQSAWTAAHAPTPPPSQVTTPPDEKDENKGDWASRAGRTVIRQAEQTMSVMSRSSGENMVEVR